jgi:hypothetical protein
MKTSFMIITFEIFSFLMSYKNKNTPHIKCGHIEVGGTKNGTYMWSPQFYFFRILVQMFSVLGMGASMVN